MENGVDTVEKHHPEESTSLPEDSLLSQSGDKHERKDSEADDVFEEAIDSNPDDAHAQMQQQQRPSNLDGSVIVDGGEKLGKVQRAEDNGDCYENFEEAMDRPDEDQSHGEEKMVAADVPDAVDGGEGDVEGIPAVIELKRSGIRGEEDGIEIEEKDGKCDGVFVLEKSENGDFCNVCPGEIGVEGGMVDEGKNAGGVQMVIESNGLEANGVAGKGERDGHGFLCDLVDHKEEKDATTDCVVSGEKSENGDFDKVDMNEALGVVLEKSENGDFDEVCANETLAAVLEKSENGDFDAVHAEEIEEILDQDESQKMGGASAYASVNEEKIPRQDESQQLEYALADVGASVDEEKIPNREGSKKTEDALTVVGASFDEEKIPHEDESEQIKDASLVVGNSVNAEKITLGDKSQQLEDALSVVGSSPDEENILYQEESQQTEDAMVDGNSVNDDVKPPRAENSPPLEVPVEMNERLETETCNSEPQLSGDNQGIPSESSEVIDGNEELGRAEEPRKQDEGDQLSLGNESIAGELLERESVSVEEYDESSSTEEDDSELIMQPAQVVPSSAVNSVDLPPPSRPAGLGSSAPLLEPAPRALQQPRANGTTTQRQSQLVEDPANGEAEEYDETREKLQMIRVKFLRLAHRLGQTPHNVVVAQVLYRLGLAEQLRGSRNTSRAGAFSFDRASAMAEQLEAAGQEALDFSCTIMVLGKTGVGKSATINSIFDEVKFSTDPFQVGTTKVQDIVGMVQGIKVRVIDTPGLLSSCMDQRRNEKILHSVKRFIKKTPPDIVLYLDRLDMQSRDFGDVPLLRTITDIFGPSIWFNAIVVLTHAASAPPDGPNGTPLSYEMFVTQRSHVVQQAIRQAAGDVRLMNPVSLVENHSACRTNRAGQRVLPNGQVWKPQLLLLSFASKILAEANTLLKLQDSPPGKPFAARSRVPPLPFLLSSLLQSRPQLKLPEEQFGDDDAMDEDLDDASDSDDESEYDELPPFKRLTKAQLAKLSKTQKKAYFDELEYREKLFMKKQLKEEKMRRKLLKKMAASAKDLPNDYNENLEEESGGAASVPVPVPDMPLPASFDSDNPTHRYRYLDNSNQWLIRPVLDNHGWDHDVGYEGLNVERLFVVKDKIPVSFSGQVTKDKKECNLQMELASSIKHGEGKATSLGFDAQTIGKDMAYTLRSETRFINFTRNKMAAGLSFTMLGDALTAGLKLEDKLMIHKRFRLVMTGGAMTSRGDVAYGGSLEATLRDKDHPIGRTLSTLGLSIMDWHGDLAIGCNVQSQFPVGRTTNMITRANLNNRGSGQISIRLNSSEQLQIALIALVPVFRNIIKNRLFGSSQTM